MPIKPFCPPPAMSPVRDMPTTGAFAFNIKVNDIDWPERIEMMEFLMERAGCGGVEYFAFIGQWLTPHFWDKDMAEQALIDFRLKFHGVIA